MAMLAPILFALMVGLPVAMLLWIARRQDQQRARRHGFDVQPTPIDKQGK